MTLAEQLARLAETHEVPGAAVAVLADGAVRTASAGVLSTRTGHPVTDDALFQIGSITKVWTATLVMDLLPDLDAEVRGYLPGFRPGVTVRHLLCHTSGLEGDVYDDFGPGDDALERYVAALDRIAPQVFPPGELFSYCNTGYCVLGRIAEVVTGRSWEALVAERLAAPLGLRVAASAEQAILGSPAIGHADGEPVPVWSLPRSNAPAGASLAMSARDLVAFAGAHLDGRVGPWAARMRVPQADVPPGAGQRGRWWALGWEVFDWPGGPVIGHDGDTVGQTAFLRAVPHRGVAVALLTNGGRPRALFQELAAPLLDRLAGVTMPAPARPPAEPVAADPARFEGRYASAAIAVEVRKDGGEFEVTMSDDEDSETFRAVPLDPGTLVAVEARDGAHTSIAFVGDAGGGRARYLHLGRALPRRDG
ncbi:serine hydrolase domain-containing protein [Nonomuraea pusilla]|uniref:CubicO group peptidase, beta-lactamase class C family n=1 Tax=Nonomuraea pusilla TaxID=46177 RepID=A0A1H7NYF9_9ACTN|nr:serine hydrolase domain-containing protein [Nonomuraea pusilla]SEL28294.1 CubicO group peptidase, beta-lactamase class C family [Nonomuraea pusilla]